MANYSSVSCALSYYGHFLYGQRSIIIFRKGIKFEPQAEELEANEEPGSDVPDGDSNIDLQVVRQDLQF